MIEPKKITGTSPSSASTAVLGTAVFGLSDCDIIRVYATLQGATGGTLDVYLQTSFDGGTTWQDYAHFAQLSAAAASRIYALSPALTNDIATVGSGTSPVISANTCIGGHWGDQMRALCVAGASTSAGAVQTILIYGARSER